jgi:hypothetical protein
MTSFTASPAHAAPAASQLSLARHRSCRSARFEAGWLVPANDASNTMNQNRGVLFVLPVAYYVTQVLEPWAP